MVYQKILSDILSMDKVCKMTYWTFVNMHKSKRKNIEKWILGLNQNIEVNSFKTFYTIPFISTIESKLRSFQYKILQRILPTNKFLKLCNIRNNDCYSFCQKEIETIEHPFGCHFVKAFWNQIAYSLSPCINLSSVINAKCILLGVTSGDNMHLINHLLIIVKRYIYIIKFVPSKLNISAVHNSIREVYDIEKNSV